MPTGPGQELTFRDHGRNLYAFVYVASRAKAVQAAAILNSLVIGGG